MDQNGKTLIKNKIKNKCSKCGSKRRKIFSTKQSICRLCFAMNSLIINSGNENINNLIKESQLSQKYKDPYLEWVPFKEFTNIKKIGQGGFSQIFKATWNVNVCISYDGIIKRSKRDIVLKVLSNSQNVDTEFLNEVIIVINAGAQTKNYAFILEYAKNGDLHHFIHKNFEVSTWNDKFKYLKSIIEGIKDIHDKKIVHRDLHSGNILINENKSDNGKNPIISDLGFSQPANNDSNLSRESQIYGIIPYMAPELFKSQSYSYASDIYSLGMIMWELTSGHRPFHDQEHGPKLILDILDRKRPEITEDTPEWRANLMKRCWHSGPSQRPKIEEFSELYKSFKYYYFTPDRFQKHKPDKYDTYDTWLKCDEAEKKRLEMIKFKKPFVKNPGYENPNSRYYSISLNSMLESINSTVSDIFSNDNWFSNDRFDIMDINSNLGNSGHNSSAENPRKHFLDELLEEKIEDEDQLSLDESIFADWQTYSALNRAPSWESIEIISFNKISIRDAKVIAEYQKLEENIIMV
ncbi:hypothetical protein Glove_386g16 [Diversispora epigaea]|uniref:Protein kinase domain-containing protein n=1 Tax=Diversispora epigaea TaxID=1348612 RepID=A0A397H345_9GLOM|nr:hypothetical protein Glove_386g16 [Diversispora epigaea]